MIKCQACRGLKLTKKSTVVSEFLSRAGGRNDVHSEFDAHPKFLKVVQKVSEYACCGLIVILACMNPLFSGQFGAP